MAPAPVDDHTEEYEQLAGLSALRVLEGDELLRFQRHAAGCERCRLMVRLDRVALARASLAVPEMDPSPDFRARVLQRAVDELQRTRAASQPAPEHISAEPVPFRRVSPSPDRSRVPSAEREGASRRLPFWRRSPYVTALAAVLVVALVSVGAFTYANQPVATYVLTGNAPGSAEVVIRRSGAVELDMRNVPDPDPGFVYEAWIIPPGKQPVAAGTTATGNAKVPLSGDVRGATIAITRERGRVDAPTSTPVMATTVES